MMVQQKRQKRTCEIDDSFMRNDVLETLFERTMPIGCIMRRDVVSLDHTQTAYDAAMLMIKKGVGCVVVTAYGKPFGMITERDIVCAVVGLKMPLRNLVLSFLASRPLIYAKPSQTVEEAIDIMRKYNIRRLVILVGGEIVGLVTARDLAMFLSPMPERLVCKNYALEDISIKKNMLEELIDFE